MLVDVSGSTEGDRDSFVTEALAILEEFQVKKLMVNRYAGISLRNEQGEYFDVYDTDQGDEMPDKDEINFAGSGGTNFDAPFNAVEEFLDLDEIDLIVHFSMEKDTSVKTTMPCLILQSVMSLVMVRVAITMAVKRLKRKASEKLST